MKRRGLLVALAIASAGCDAIPAGLFRPALEPPDVTPPVFSNPQPPPGTQVVGVSVLVLDVSDPPQDGLPGSGVPSGGVTAMLAGGGFLPVSVVGSTVTVQIGALPDGPFQVVVTARDRAGNQQVHVFSHVLDRTPPPLGFLFTPGEGLQVSGRVFQVTISVQVGPEPNFQSGTVEAHGPGADGSCGTGDDAVPPELVGEPTRVLSGPGSFTFVFFLENPVPPGGTPRALAYCWKARAADSAGNVSSIFRQSVVLWGPPS